MEQFDVQDKAILDVLIEDSRMSTRKIAKKLDMPHSTVHKKIQQMIQRGIIEGYTIKTNLRKVGKGTLAYVLVGTKPEVQYAHMMEELMKHEEIEDIATITGDFDILFKIRTESNDALDSFVFNYLRKFPEITNTHTIIAFRSWKG